MSHDPGFVDLAAAGEVLLEEIDEFVEQWHEETTDLTLNQYLGMTDEEYRMWMMDPDVLGAIVAARHKKTPIMQFIDQESAEDFKIAARAENLEKIDLIKKWIKNRNES